MQLVFEDYRDEVNEASPESDDYNTSMENDHQSFVLGYSSSDVDLKPLHPLPSQLPFYCQTYAEKVDGLVKLLHIPSLEKIVKEATDHYESLSKSKEALLFAVYFSVIVR